MTKEPPTKEDAYALFLKYGFLQLHHDINELEEMLKFLMMVRK